MTPGLTRLSQLFFCSVLMATSCKNPEVADQPLSGQGPVLSACVAVDNENALRLKAQHSFPSAVHGMCIADDGRLFYTDSYPQSGTASRVYYLDAPYTAKPSPVDITGSNLSGLLWHEDALYVAELGSNEIRKYSADMELLSSWQVQNPWNMACDGTHIFAVTYQGHVVKLLPDGGVETLTTDLLMPFDIICAGNDHFWVSEQIGAHQNGRVVKIDNTGRIVERIATPFENPEGLAMDADGILYVADTAAGRIMAIHPDGNACLLSDRFELPICMALSPTGELFVNSNHNGGLLLSFGR